MNKPPMETVETQVVVLDASEVEAACAPMPAGMQVQRAAWDRVAQTLTITWTKVTP